MDNFVDILIYGLIIATFLSSILRKKKVLPKNISEDSQVQPGPVNRPVQRVQPPPQKQSGEVEFDLFKEFENFFNVDTAKPKPQQTKSYSTVREPQRKQNDYIPVPEKSFHEQTASEHSVTDKWERKKKEIEQIKRTIDSKIEKEANQFEKYLKKGSTTGTGIVSSLSQRLKDPVSLREYVVISEILGKPRAHRKWNRRSIS